MIDMILPNRIYEIKTKDGTIKKLRVIGISPKGLGVKYVDNIGSIKNEIGELFIEWKDIDEIDYPKYNEHRSINYSSFIIDILRTPVDNTITLNSDSDIILEVSKMFKQSSLHLSSILRFSHCKYIIP